MAKRTQEAKNSQAAAMEMKRPLGLDDLIQQGARQIIQQAIEAELAALLERYSNVKTLDGRRAVVRNGYLPEREIVTAIGPVPVQVPKVRDRSGSGVKFNSNLVPPYVRRSPRVSAALPWLYLRGVSTGDMSEALSVLVGDDAKGLSPNVVVRLKAQWAEEFEQWNRRDLKHARWVYWWADGIHTGARSEDSDGQCLLVIIGVKPDGSKERVAIADGYRESKASWRDLLLDLKARGLQAGPLLAAGDGAMGLWPRSRKCSRSPSNNAAGFTRSATCSTRCPRRSMAAQRRTWRRYGAATRAESLVAFERFVATYGAKYPKAVEKLTKDRNELLAFYDFPAEHWQHLRTTNPIESTFATVRHRTSRARNCLSRATFLGMAFKLVESAEQSWRRIRGAERIEQLLKGIPFEDGVPVIESAPAQQPLAA
ncbi:IS256 family transposase [Burkholderia ubonensis]|uniref:IS256 family transposase n=1 Tax=Burkholderia ubonensis TaxID=101571 RepID=UPI00403306E2